jgi:hypothetical protein
VEYAFSIAPECKNFSFYILIVSFQLKVTHAYGFSHLFFVTNFMLHSTIALLLYEICNRLPIALVQSQGFSCMRNLSCLISKFYVY